MRVAVLGAGNIGQALAVLLSSRGHVPTVWSRSGPPETRAVRTTGKLNLEATVRFESSLAAAVNGANAIVLAIPAASMREALADLAPLVEPGQPVLVTPAASASPLLLAHALAARGLKTPIAGLAATILTSRVQPDGTLMIGAIRTRVGLACVDPIDTMQVLANSEQLFGISFTVLENMLALALAYATPVVHAALMLCNISRIEKGESWREFECTTPAISRLVEQLDAERLAVARACRLELPSFVDHCNATFGLKLERYQAIAQTVAALRNGGPLGPLTLNARQISEDLPYGLAVYLRLARHAGIEAPLTASVLTTMSALCDRRFEAENSMMDAVDQAFTARSS